MAGIKFSRKEFEKHFKLTEELKEQISLFGTHFESADNETVELEITPNRPDLYSLQGFIRAFLAFTGKKKGLKEYKINKPEKDYEVKVDDSVLEVRPYTACAIIKKLNFDDEKIKEIIDIQEKIHATLGRNRKKIAVGIYPLEKIKLPIKFEARKPEDIKFIPLEAGREMNGRQILSGHPTGRDYAHLLEGKTKFPVFVDANNEILSMPPIINSHKTGKITENTKEIFIECSGFDLEILKKTLNILVTMFADMGGDIYQMKVKHKKEYITPELSSERIKLSIEHANKLLGLDLNEKQVKELLEKMGYSYNGGIVKIPAWRTDILHEVDVIEDIAIAYGYENFVPEIPNISFAGEEAKVEVIKRKIANILSGLNMLETSSLHLTTEDDQFKKMGLKEKEGMIEVENSKTEYSLLRNNLLHSNLKILSENTGEEYPQKIFELGRVFEKDNKEESGIKEIENLCVCIANSQANFTDIKQALDYLARMTGRDYNLEEAENSFFINGRCAKIIINRKEIGYLGEIKPQILENLKIKMPICALEINLEQFYE
jgi:phenylalanyl-tRNA synthetase beta chain